MIDADFLYGGHPVPTINVLERMGSHGNTRWANAAHSSRLTKRDREISPTISCGRWCRTIDIVRIKKRLEMRLNKHCLNLSPCLPFSRLAANFDDMMT